MKRTLTLIACVAVCCAMMVSCKNAKTTEPTTEEIQQQKVALADSVLAEIDALAERFYDASSKSFQFKLMELTDDEKIVKPDYLLEPSLAENFVTKSQKINALAIYAMEMGVREIYEMPMEETKAAIAKLAAEINHPIDFDFFTSGAPISDKMRREYDICKERGDLPYFWKFHYAVLTEMSYLLVMDPELFFSKITDEQLSAYGKKGAAVYATIGEMAKYDDEMEMLRQFRDKYRYTSPDEWEEVCKSRESQIQNRITHKDKFIARRNALLQ